MRERGKKGGGREGRREGEKERRGGWGNESEVKGHESGRW